MDPMMSSLIEKQKNVITATEDYQEQLVFNPYPRRYLK
jgi:hypothetical protein